VKLMLRGQSVELIRDTRLLYNGRTIASVSKKEPCKGTITGSKRKKIGVNQVYMYFFHPDGQPEDCVYLFGEKSFRKIE
jgi:hypothetical protein